MTLRCLATTLLLLATATAEDGTSRPQPATDIRVSPAGWGSADPENIGKVLESTVAQFRPHLAKRHFPTIVVSHDKDGPITRYKRGAGGEIFVGLNVSNRYWAQYAFQFSHEFCHILCNYRPDASPNRWFEESLCETAALFALRSMAREWKDSPPYPNWKEFSSSLKKYADERLKKFSLAKDTPFSTWFVRNEASLRATPRSRNKNGTVAALLLPLFEKDPSRWEAVGSLNPQAAKKRESFREFLQRWHDAAPKKHRGFIGELAKGFGLSVE